MPTIPKTNRGANVRRGKNLSTGAANTAVGWSSLSGDTTASFNAGVGAGALALNNEDSNTAVGAAALFLNTTGADNTAQGAFALFNNNTGFQNAAHGESALFSNTEGNFNTAIGASTLLNNITGTENTAVGTAALSDNATGGFNTALGVGALMSNTMGEKNTAVGYSAGNLTTGNNNIDIGYNVVGVAGESNTIRIGNSDATDIYIKGISGATSSGGAAVFVNSTGKLGTSTSSARFKEDIRPMGTASEAILALKPVSFHYKKEIDAQRIPQFGLVAEDVEKVDSDLVIRDRDGKPYTVRYEQVNAMLLNEFLKEHQTVQELKKEILSLVAIVKEQGAQIQRVSAQLEMNKPSQQVVDIP